MKKLLDERKNRILEFQELIKKTPIETKPIDIPDDVFMQCIQCQSAIYKKDLDNNFHICPYCGFHFRIGANLRMLYTLDKNSFKELNNNLNSVNPLGMEQYDEKLEKGKLQSGLNEAFLSGTGKIDGVGVAIGVLDSNFMMGSMGSVVGEKITRLIEYSYDNNLPTIIFSASGGARMQEGILSLMQMAKTSASINLLDEKGLLFVSVLTNPTTGGVAASYASLGDIIIAEESSLIGFAGARVIKQTINQDLPEGFQTDYFQLKKGQVDLVASRKDLKSLLSKLLKLHSYQVKS